MRLVVYKILATVTLLNVHTTKYVSLKLVRKIHDTVKHTYVRPNYSFETVISVGLAQACTNYILVCISAA